MCLRTGSQRMKSYENSLWLKKNSLNTIKPVKEHRKWIVEGSASNNQNVCPWPFEPIVSVHLKYRLGCSMFLKALVFI